MLDTSKIYTSNNYGDFKVIEYRSCSEVIVEFILTGFKAVARASYVRSGNIKDRLHPSVYGFGFIGEGRHKVVAGGKVTKSYSTWRSMLERCYEKKAHEKRPTYKGVTVCDEWRSFQNFAEWFEANYIESFHIDKDISQRSVKNKIYSPNTCKFVSPKDNSVEAQAKTYKMRDPSGVERKIYNMREFAANNGLSNQCMLRVYKGEHKKHKGWTRG